LISYLFVLGFILVILGTNTTYIGVDMSNENEEDILDKVDIPVKLSFNQMKHILYKFKDYQYSSTEGQISVALTDSLRTWIEKKAKQGKLPPVLASSILDDTEDTNE
jgi:hypothetical protein